MVNWHTQVKRKALSENYKQIKEMGVGWGPNHEQL
jgi:hypothetical protein